MLVSALGFFLLSTLPADFSFPVFVAYLATVGVGMGLFSAPNTASIMSSVPARYRGVASGMRATFMNAGMLISMALFFTIVISGLSAQLPSALHEGLRASGLPEAAASRASALPPAAALFAALLGYNPLARLLPHALLATLPASAAAHLTSPTFFSSLVAQPFAGSMRLVFWTSVVISVVAAFASALRAGRSRQEAPLVAVEPLLDRARLEAGQAAAEPRP
jgi:hypothetical protein